MKKEYLYIAGGLVIIIGGVTVISKFTNLFDGIGEFFGFDSEERDREDLSDSNDRLNQLQGAGKNASYPISTYKNLATQLEAALKGVGNDLDEIAEVFDQMRNEVDVRILNREFGIRGGENMNNWLKSDIANNVFNWTVEYNGGTHSTVNHVTVADMVREILKAKGITYAI